jgi:hypothetical protein
MPETQITRIDVPRRSMAEELMRSLALTLATSAMLTFAFPLTPQVRAQGTDDGAVGRPLQLDGGPSLGSDNRGQVGSRSEGAEPSASAKQSQSASEKSGEIAIDGRSKTHIGSRHWPRHHFAMHKRRYHVFAFHMPRRRFMIPRHGRRFVGVNASTGV